MVGIAKIKVGLNSESKSFVWQTYFTNRLVVSNSHKVNTQFYTIQSLFCGEIHLTMNILGLQLTSAGCPCYWCVVQLNDLQNCIRYIGAQCRTVEKIGEQARIVQASRTVKEMKKKAQENESVIEKRIWNIDFQQICAPILYIILGITKICLML